MDPETREENNPYYNLDDQKNLVNENDEETNSKINKNWTLTMRLGFIRKVYGILSLQLIFTFLMCITSIFSDSFREFQLNHIGLFIIILITSLITSIVLVCFRNVARSVPTNYILLSLFTFCEGYMVSLICGMSSPRIVLMAAAMTSGVVIALTVYAVTTKTDFTVMGSLIFVISALMLLFGIFVMFTNNSVLNTIYTCLGVLVFSLYLVFDTQLIVGKHELKLDIDDYIVGAMMLYLDIIGLFLEILKLLDRK